MLLTLSDNLKNPIEEIEISRSFNKRNIPRNISKFIKTIDKYNNMYKKIYYAY